MSPITHFYSPSERILSRCAALVGLLVPLLVSCGGDGGSGKGGNSPGGAGGMGGVGGTSGAGGVGGTSGASGASGKGGMGGAGGTGGASGSSSGGSGGMEMRGLNLFPGGTTLIYGASQTFNCMVTGFSNRACTFALDEGASAGTLTADGTYTALATSGTYHVTATSVADATLSKKSTIKVVAPGAPGEWTNVTSPLIHLEVDYNPADNYGVLDVVADPAKQSDLWAFVCYQGAWKSTDYGETWNKVSTGQNGAALDTGRPWAAAIEPTKNRDPSRPPVLYTTNGYGNPLGIFKSVDGGVNWTVNQGFAADTSQDAYSIEIDPYDSQHLLVGFHERGGLAESTDGGSTWRTIATAANAGISLYAFFIDTGSAATTRTTWITIAQVSGGMNGIQRTTNSGASWTKVSGLEHGHGACQIDQPGGGVIYAAGAYGDGGSGVYRSTDYGATWRLVSNGMLENSVFGTPNYIYAQNAQGFDPGMAGLQRATRASGTDWTNMMEQPGLTDGAKRAAVVYDGTHYILVTGNWHAGIWRYVEP